MKFYHFPPSPNSRRVELVAAQLGLTFDERQIVDVTQGEHHRPEYLALNPNGLTPTLVDGERVVWESRAIAQYLATKVPEAGLQGRSDIERVDVIRWQCWDAGHLMPEVFTLVWERLVKAMLDLGSPDQPAVDRASGEVRRFLQVLDVSLAGRTWLAGDAMTLADLSVAASLTYSDPLELPVGEFPRLAAWFDRIRALEAWSSTQPRLG